MSPSAMGLFICAMLFSHLSIAQNTIAIPDSGWRLWLDRDATWENDTIYLPEEVNPARLPMNPPTGGWKSLHDGAGISVSLPSTVEEHYWGIAGFRNYKDEYVYEDQDSLVKNGNYLGVSWWWCDVDVPKNFQGKRVILFIRGARLRAEIYWNGKLVGYNIISEISFTSDVSKAVEPGKKNVLAIRITNPGGRLDWLDTQLMSWGGTGQKFHKSHGFGGLDRGLRLSAHDAIYFDNVWILNTPRPRTINVHSTIINTLAYSAEARVRLEILDPNVPGKICSSQEKKIQLAASGETDFNADYEYGDAQLWDCGTPKLYRMRVTLTCTTKKGSQQEILKDVRTVNFGFRWFDADGVGENAMLRLNGERVRLTSAISWGFWGKNGLWPTPELAEREVRAAKTLGMNCIQFHRNVGKTEVLDVQDRLGLMRCMEPGGGQTSFGEKFSLHAPSPKEKIDDSGKNGDATTFAEKYMEEKIIRMIRDHRSHPSLVLYCIQNEIHPDLRNARIFRVLRRMYREDPSRIIVLHSGFPSGTPSVNQAWMRPYNDDVLYDTGNGYSGWWDDHTVGGPGVWRDEMYKNLDDFTHRSINNKEIVMWGEMLGAAVPDNHAAMVRELKAAGGSSYDLKEHEKILAAYDHFLDRWGFRSAFPSAESLFVSIGNKSYDFWGRVVETARLAEPNDYFVMSGWESTAIENHSGLVDNLRNFKGNPQLISKHLAPLRVVIKVKSLVVATGERALIDFYLLNETHVPHGKQLRVWMENPAGEKVQVGVFDIPLYQSDRFVYPVAMNVRSQLLASEGQHTIHAEVAGAISEEKILVIDPVGIGPLPRNIGIISAQPALMKPFELFPGAKVEPYQTEKQYDLVVAANRFSRPPETQTEPNTEIQGTDDDELYRTINYGDETSLEFIVTGLPKGNAVVTLKFAELFQNAENMRVFDVALNGETVLKDFDVFKAAGGKNIAYDRRFTVSAPDGIVYIKFPRVPKPSARICAIKIEAGDTVVAINCGGKSYTDRNGLAWKPYLPPTQLDRRLLEKVKNGMPLLVLSEGEVAANLYGEELGEAGAFHYLGHVGDARASWMGNWYFVRKHPVFDGMPTDCAMTSYYQVPVTNGDGLLLEGNNVEVFAGYSRDHDRNIGAASFTTILGKGRIVFHSVPGVVSGLNGESTGMHTLLVKRLTANSIRFLTDTTHDH